MAQAMTASRTTYQNNYPSSSASVSADMHHSWHPQTHTSHPTANGINGVNSARTRPIQTPNGTATANRITHKKSDFYKNGRPTEVIVIDSESPAPQPQLFTKRKRENSISTSTTVSQVTKRARKSQNDETAIHHEKSGYSTTTKPHSVTWFRDERGVYRAREVIVPKVEEVSYSYLTIKRQRGNPGFHACMLPCHFFREQMLIWISRLIARLQLTLMTLKVIISLSKTPSLRIDVFAISAFLTNFR